VVAGVDKRLSNESQMPSHSLW